MREENHGVATFKSTHYSIQGEGVFEENNISFKTIPTPREITYSCGLAILFKLDDLDRVKELVDNDILLIDSLYKYNKGSSNRVEKII